MGRYLALTSLLLVQALLPAGVQAAESPFHVDVLDNGLEVISLESVKVPLVTMVLTCRAGGLTETPDINGLTHLWEHMFFKGNKRIPDQEAFNQRIRQLGIVFNGDTSAEKVRYYFTLPSVFLDEGLQFMADAIQTPLLDKKELEKERRVVLDEYDRSASRPSFDLRNLQRRLIYGATEHVRDPLGSRRVIETATRKQLLRIKDEVFVPKNCAMLVSGDLERQQLLKAITKHFAAWSQAKDWKPPVQEARPRYPQEQHIIMARPMVRDAQVSIVMPGPRVREQPDATYAADVLISLLSHKSGRFYQKYIDSGLTTYAGLGYFTQAQAGELRFYAMTEPSKALQVRDALLAEPKLWLGKDYFTEAQLSDVRRRLKIDHLRQLNQPSAYIKTLAFWWAVTGLDYYRGYLGALAATTLDDVRQFVKQWLVDKPHLTSVLVSPEAAKAAGLKTNDGPLVKKLLADYEAARKRSRGEAAP